MELTPDKIRENIVVEYYKKGIDFKTTAKALIAFGFAGHFVKQVPHLIHLSEIIQERH